MAEETPKVLPISVSHVETTMVEESDDRLAAVEEAKRSGEPFRSVASRGGSVVPTPVAAKIAADKAATDTYVGRGGVTYAAHLEDWHDAIHSADGPEIVAKTNEEKARAHAEYSAELVRRRQAEDAEVRAKMAEGYDVSLAIQQAQLEQARADGDAAAAHERRRMEAAKNAKPALEVSRESAEVLNGVEDGELSSVAERLMPVTHVPNALEEPIREALRVKDAIIAAEEPYAEHAMAPDELLERDHAGVPVLKAAASPEALRESSREGAAAADNAPPTGIDASDGSAEAVPVETSDEAPAVVAAERAVETPVETPADPEPVKEPQRFARRSADD